MKSFRLYLTYQPKSVLKYVGEYSESELVDFEDRFAADLKRRRSAIWALISYVGVWIAATFGSRFIFGVDTIVAYAIHGFAALGFLLIVGIWGSPRCPACQNEIDQSIGEHCPECGSVELTRDQWLYIQCDSCHRQLERWQKPTYETTFCSHCGIRLVGATQVELNSSH